MKRTIQFISSLLFCFTLLFGAEAQQRRRQGPAQPNAFQPQQRNKKSKPKEAATPAQDSTQYAELTAVISAERVKEVREASDRMTKEFREKGGDAVFNGDDLGLMNTAKKATFARDINLAAQSRELTKGIKKELVQKAMEVSKRVVGEFNEKGRSAAFSWDDLNYLQAFRTALVAVDTLQKAASPAQIKNMKQEEVQEAIEASKRILATFNEKGNGTDFTSKDEGTLKKFQSVLDKSK